VGPFFLVNGLRWKQTSLSTIAYDPDGPSNQMTKKHAPATRHDPPRAGRSWRNLGREARERCEQRYHRGPAAAAEGALTFAVAMRQCQIEALFQSRARVRPR